MKTFWRFQLACLFIRYGYADTFASAWDLTESWLEFHEDGYSPKEAMIEDNRR